MKSEEEIRQDLKEKFEEHPNYKKLKNKYRSKLNKIIKNGQIELL